MNFVIQIENFEKHNIEKSFQTGREKCTIRKIKKSILQVLLLPVKLRTRMLEPSSSEKRY